LLQEDYKWEECLQKAVSIKSGTSLRILFATILLFCNPTNPIHLWNNNLISLIDDLKHLANYETQNQKLKH
ncbi:14041_t:CDS:1, partial [Gigaspora rosea]